MPLNHRLISLSVHSANVLLQIRTTEPWINCTKHRRNKFFCQRQLTLASYFMHVDKTTHATKMKVQNFPLNIWQNYGNFVQSKQSLDTITWRATPTLQSCIINKQEISVKIVAINWSVAINRSVYHSAKVMLQIEQVLLRLVWLLCTVKPSHWFTGSRDTFWQIPQTNLTVSYVTSLEWHLV